jgi:glc operon protein GlcG
MSKTDLLQSRRQLTYAGAAIAIAAVAKSREIGAPEFIAVVGAGGKVLGTIGVGSGTTEQDVAVAEAV